MAAAPRITVRQHGNHVVSSAPAASPAPSPAPAASPAPTPAAPPATVSPPYTFSWVAPLVVPPATNAYTAGAFVAIRFKLGGDRGLDVLTGGWPVSQRYDCTTITGNCGPAINIFESSSATGGTMKVRIDGNHVGNAANSGSGTTLGPGIVVKLQGKTTNTVTIVNNIVRQTLGSRAIDVEALGPVTTGQPITVSDIVITGNDADTNDELNPSGSLDAIYIAADDQGSPAQINAEIHGNIIPSATGTHGSYDWPSFDGNAPWLYYRIATSSAAKAFLFNFGGHANANTELAATQTSGTAGADITNFGGVQLTTTAVNSVP